MPRLPLLEESQASISKPLLEAMRARRGGTLMALDKLLIHSEPVAQGWTALFSSYYKDASIDPVCRELAILRAVTLVNCPMEIKAHRAALVKAGASEGQAAAVEQWRGSDLFSDRERAVLAYAESMTRDVKVSQAEFDALRGHFDERGIVELTFIIGVYNMVGRFVEALELRP